MKTNRKTIIVLSAFIITFLALQKISLGQETILVAYDYIDSNGVLRGEVNEVEIVSSIGILSLNEWNIQTIMDNGPTERRIDLVFLGDGYREQDLDNYIYQINSIVGGFFDELPFDEYQSYFNVHRIDVITNDVNPGVDNDPDYGGCGIDRDTILEMYFECEENMPTRKLEKNRYIVIDEAEQAPDDDYLFAVANSSTHGGSGELFYNSKISCLSGGHSSRVQTALHEFGHTFGHLEDEYNEFNYNYTGSDPENANLSIYEEEDMLSEEKKWYQWLSEENVGTFLGGGRYYSTGIYRPTVRSLMKALSDPIPHFDQVNVEQFVINIYKHDEIGPIEDATPPGTYRFDSIFFVEPMQPATHNLDIQWYLDDEPIEGATGVILNASSLGLTGGKHELKVKVVDNTELVRDEDARAEFMTEERVWTLGIDGWWKLDESSGTTAYDSAGENNGTLTNMNPPTDWVSGKINGALKFDGDDDYVSLNPISVLTGKNISISLWIKASSINPEYNERYIFSQGYDVGYNIKQTYGVYESGDYISFYSNSTWPNIESDDLIIGNKWYHIAATCSDIENSYDDIMILYLNGKETKRYTGSFSGGSYGDSYIGGCYPYDDYSFDGLIDDVRVYGWTLSPDEIWNVMTEDMKGFRLKDSDGSCMALISNKGDIFLKDKLTQQVQTISEDSQKKEFLVREGQNIVAKIDCSTGDMQIKGSVHENQGTISQPSGNNFIVRNAIGDIVAYISSTGELYLQGIVYSTGSES